MSARECKRPRRVGLSEPLPSLGRAPCSGKADVLRVWRPTMILDPRTMDSKDVYRFIISAVVPRPIAFVSTVSAAGETNLAPFSYYNAVASEPPLVAIAISDRPADPKDTLRNVRETREFVANVVSEPLLDAMVRTAGEWPRSASEFGVSGLTALPS